MRRNLSSHISTRPRYRLTLASKAVPRPALGVFDLSCGSEHAARGAGARPRRDAYDASFSVREGSGGGTRVAAERPFLCSTADRLPDGTVWVSSSYRPCRCRLRRSVGPALPGSLAAQYARCRRRKDCVMGDLPPPHPKAPPTCSSLPDESINGSCV